MKQNSDFLPIKQAKVFLNQLLGTELDEQEFFTYCFENSIPIAHKALTEFSVIKGLEITEFEASEFYKFNNQEKTYDSEEKENIYQNCNFSKRVEEIRIRIYHKMRKEEYKIKKEKMFNDLKYSQYTYEEKFRFLESHVMSFNDATPIINDLMISDSEYIEVASRKEKLDRLNIIKESILVKKINGKNYFFSDQNIEVFPGGIYKFLDEDLTSDYEILRKIEGKHFGSSIPYKLSNFLFINGNIYMKYGKNNKEIFNINPSLIEGILNEGFLKEDIDNSIKNTEITETKCRSNQVEQIENKYLSIIGALLEERKRASGGKRIQSLVAQNIEEMTKNTDAMLSKSTLEKIFSSANKAFKPFNNNEIG
ncbi:hypothetical protein [Acinetobacter bereziniae]|uniref:hypothetical protein n=1 Tax=Acinetobacter bereziniae TaxID=106648 RepID=UPI003018789F